MDVSLFVVLNKRKQIDGNVLWSHLHNTQKADEIIVFKDSSLGDIILKKKKEMRGLKGDGDREGDMRGAPGALAMFYFFTLVVLILVNLWALYLIYFSVCMLYFTLLKRKVTILILNDFL